MYEQYFNTFRYVQHDDYPDTCAIKLIVPPFEGVVVIVGRKFGIVNPNTDQEALQFDYEIMDKPEGLHIDEKEIHQLLGAILLAILERKFTEDGLAAQTTETTQDDGQVNYNSVEFNEQTGETTIQFDDINADTDHV